MKKVLIFVLTILISIIYYISISKNTSYVFNEKVEMLSFSDYYLKYNNGVLNSNNIIKNLSNNFIDNDYQIKELYFYFNNYESLFQNKKFVISNNLKLQLNDIYNDVSAKIKKYNPNHDDVIGNHGLSVKVIKINTHQENINKYRENYPNIKISTKIPF